MLGVTKWFVVFPASRGQPYECITRVTLSPNTTITLISNVYEAAIGQAVTFTATVSPCCQATGTVTFFDGSGTLGVGTLTKAGTSLQTAFSTSSLSVGTHSITAQYNGDGYDNASTSAVLIEKIAQNSATTITSSPNPSVSSQSVVLSISVSPSNATGTITITDGGSVIAGGVVLSSAKAYSVPFTKGTHSLKATYSGDSNYSGSTSPVLIQIVN
jgi:hypothetical protein